MENSRVHQNARMLKRIKFLQKKKNNSFSLDGKESIQNEIDNLRAQILSKKG